MDSKYRDNMTLDEAKALILDAIGHAISNDSSSGGLIRMLNITKDGTTRFCFDYNGIPKY